jgi:hypothetical protein
MVRLIVYGSTAPAGCRRRLTFHRVVRGDRAHADLQQHQADDDEEVLARGLHRRRGLGAEQRISRGTAATPSSASPLCSQSIAAMPASSRMMLAIDHIAAEVVIVLPTSGSCGQLLV